MGEDIIGYQAHRTSEEQEILVLRAEVGRLSAQKDQAVANAARLSKRARELETVVEALFWSAKEFVDDWRKGDFDLPELAALDAASLDETLTRVSGVLSPTPSQERDEGGGDG